MRHDGSGAHSGAREVRHSHEDVLEEVSLGDAGEALGGGPSVVAPRDVVVHDCEGLPSLGREGVQRMRALRAAPSPRSTFATTRFHKSLSMSSFNY